MAGRLSPAAIPGDVRIGSEREDPECTWPPLGIPRTSLADPLRFLFPGANEPEPESGPLAEAAVALVGEPLHDEGAVVWGKTLGWSGFVGEAHTLDPDRQRARCEN